MTFKEKAIQALSFLKLDIVNANNDRIAYLELITEKDTHDIELIEKFTQWREKYKACFLSEFIPTFHRTKQWLNNAIIQNNDRLLFKIFTNENMLVGHIGVIYIGKCIEYDYYILGCKVEIKNFALTIARKFLLWVCEIVNVEYIVGNVRSDNKHAIDFHLRTGFSIHKKIPLKKIIISNDEFKLEPDKSLSNSDYNMIEIRAFKADLQKDLTKCRPAK